MLGFHLSSKLHIYIWGLFISLVLSIVFSIPPDDRATLSGVLFLTFINSFSLLVIAIFAQIKKNSSDLIKSFCACSSIGFFGGSMLVLLPLLKLNILSLPADEGATLTVILLAPIVSLKYGVLTIAIWLVGIIIYMSYNKLTS